MSLVGAVLRCGDRSNGRGNRMSTKTQILIYLIILGIFDVIIPIQITALVLVHVLFQKPRWFREWVEEIYRS